MARPSLEVAPVRKTSVASFGIPLMTTAAVSVLPCTTLTRSSGCFFTYKVPPPFKDSFCGRHPLPFSDPTPRNTFDYLKEKKGQRESKKPTLFNAAKLRTLTPSLSALKMAFSMCVLIPSLAQGRKYCGGRCLSHDRKTQK